MAVELSPLSDFLLEHILDGNLEDKMKRTIRHMLNYIF